MILKSNCTHSVECIFFFDLEKHVSSVEKKILVESFDYYAISHQKIYLRDINIKNVNCLNSKILL